MVKKFKSAARSLCETQIPKLYFMMVIETLEAVYDVLLICVNHIITLIQPRKDKRDLCGPCIWYTQKNPKLKSIYCLLL